MLNLIINTRLKPVNLQSILMGKELPYAMVLGHLHSWNGPPPLHLYPELHINTVLDNN